MKNPYRALGIIFSCLGGVFFLLGILLANLLPSEEDVLVFLAAFGFPGLVFLGTGFGFLLYNLRLVRRKEDLLAHGERIQAEVLGLEPNYSAQINGRNPQRLVCRYEEDGILYVCRSENLSGYPQVIEDTVTVYRDPYNRKKYYVDAESILRPGIEL